MTVTASLPMQICSLEVLRSSQKSLVDGFAGAATAIAKPLTPKLVQDVAATWQSVYFSPGKKVDIKNEEFGAASYFTKPNGRQYFKPG